ncbi:MAG TPA: ATP-binding cassette domain-containing protein [Chloroflexi bacterium]|nr:ATP-binding cassette domain-containing protein [Chloroflexota bacterium]
MFRLHEVTVHYGQRLALDNLSLHIPPGTFTLVTGPSGGGKTTLARVLAGITPHAIPGKVTGEVRVDGHDPQLLPLAETALHVGMVFQNPAAQLFNLRVDDEVAFGPRNRGLSEAEVAQRVTWALQACGILHLRERLIRTLSGGEKQRVAIAAVLAMRPPALILDEPTSGLDLPGTHQVVEALRQLHAAGTTLLLIEHRLGEVAPLASRTVLLHAGRCVGDGDTETLLNETALLRDLGVRRLPRTPRCTWETLMQTQGYHPSAGRDPLVQLEGIGVRYGQCQALRDISLTIYAGDFLAVVGDNGAGKTTLARVLAGLIRPHSGKLRTGWGGRLRPGRDVGLLFQDPLEQLFCDTVAEEVAFGAQNYDTYDPAFQQQLLEQSDLVQLASYSPLKLSSGQQQRVALAAVLSLRPRLIILDEPTLGQDWAHLERLMLFLQELNRQGHTILLITHDYRLVYHYAQRVVILREGELVVDGVLHREW